MKRTAITGLVAAACLVLPGCTGPGEVEQADGRPPLDRLLAEIDPPPRNPDPTRPRSGRWRRPATPADASLTAEQREQIERLESIGYVSGSMPAPQSSNVVVHRAEQAWPGLNFYTSGHAPEARLLDMDGNVLHRWRRDFEATWPGDRQSTGNPNRSFWRRAHLYENGDLLAIHDGVGILKLDRDSNLLWARRNGAHHDLQVLDNGEIYVLTRTAHLHPGVSETVPILEDYVTVLDAEGREKRRVSLLECFRNSEDEHSWFALAREFWRREESRRLVTNPADIFHTNSIVFLDDATRARVPQFAAGDVLVSMCHLDAIAVVDLARKKVVWSQDGFALQHDPTIVADGKVLLFDNNWRPGQSRVVELDPDSGEVHWQYAGSDDRPFFSRTCGTAARLPNGNTLVTESDNGRAFELTPAREIVWEFYNPFRAGADDEFIATLFEMERLPADFPIDWVEPPERP